MKRNDLIDVIDARQKKNAGRGIEEATVISVSGPLASVRVKGTSEVRKVDCDVNLGAEPGMNCLIAWVQRRGRYTIVSTSRGAVATDHQLRGRYELFPPSNFQVLTGVAGNLVIMWDTPPQILLTYELQYNSSAVESGSTTLVKTSGSVVIMAAASLTYFRVRSITDDFRYSSWSPWASGTPSAGGGGSVAHLGDVGDVDLTGLGNGDVLIYDSTSGHWIPDIRTLTGLSDVDITGLSDSYIIYWDGTANLWKVEAVPGAAHLSDIGDVNVTGLSDGDSLRWNNGASEWQPFSPPTTDLKPFWEQVTPVSLSNSSAETSLLTTDYGNPVKSPSWWLAGHIWEIEFWGGMNTKETSPGYLTLTFYLRGDSSNPPLTALGSSTLALTLPAGSGGYPTGWGYHIQAAIYCDSIVTSTNNPLWVHFTAFGQDGSGNDVFLSKVASGSWSFGDSPGGSTTYTAIDLTAQFTVADPDNSILLYSARELSLIP